MTHLGLYEDDKPHNKVTMHSHSLYTMPPLPSCAVTTQGDRRRSACPIDAPRHLMTKEGWRRHREVLWWRLQNETYEEFKRRRIAENRKLRERPRRPSPKLDVVKSKEAYVKRLANTDDAVFDALPSTLALSCFESVRKRYDSLEEAERGKVPWHVLELWRALKRRGHPPICLVPHSGKQDKNGHKTFVVPLPHGCYRMYLGRKMTMAGNVPHPLAFGNRDKHYLPQTATLATRRRSKKSKTRPLKRSREMAFNRNVESDVSGSSVETWELTEDECDDAISTRR